MAKVAFLGTGLLGSAMAEGMLKRGESVTVWNRTASKAQALEKLGAKVAPTPAEAVADADRVHMTFSDDAVVDGVLSAALPRLRKDAVVIDHTTTSPRETATRYARMQQRGIRFVHAPVFMSPQMARDSIGILMTSCPQALFEELRDPLQRMTGEAWYLGDDPQRAAAYKIFGNSMLFVITAGVTDVFAMAKDLGIPAEDALQVFSKFQPCSVIKARGDKIVRRDFSASFELTMARKDLRLMIEAAGSQPLAVLPAIAKRMDEAIAKGHGADDLAAIAAEVA
jgi:3-hydroxyisobutyrate dehydrogenase-like beta-hydroxyacid dehydrogenase